MTPSETLTPSPPQPLDTSLQARADALRAALKDYERAFAAQHNGRKPTKEDIKADAEVALKYREYNKVRDAITGKAKTDGDRDEASPKRKREGQETRGRGKGEKKRKVEIATPRRERGKGKAELEEGMVSGHGDDGNVQEDGEQEDAPEDLLPIGPTPQRDGTVLGIFDLMSNPPGSRSSYGMGTPRRRQRDCYNATLSHDATMQMAAATAAGAEPELDAALVAATPQRSRRQNHQGDLLQHLAGTPATGNRAKNSRTPISEGRKFMLSQFFATPSTVRYQKIIHTGETPETKEEMVKTPLKSSGVGKEAEEGRVMDETPRYLKRTASFKDRLLSASSSSSSIPGRSGTLDNERPGRTGPGPALVKVKAKAKFQPKPLSQIAAELLKQRPGGTRQEGNPGVDVDGDDEDDMEALRELEDAEMNALSADEEQQQQHQQQQQIPRAVYKKKGLKRQTRRVVMKPQPKLGRNKKNDNNDNDDDYADDNDEEEDVNDDDGRFDNNNDDDDEGGTKPATKSKAEKGKGKSKGKGKKNKTSDENETEADGGKDGGEIRTYDPNAVSHMNFKSLKIKNKNTKGKFRGRGGGRFGRTRHR